MAYKLTEADVALRKLVEDTKGDLNVVAETLGRSKSAVTARLRSDKNHDWWLAFKKRRSRDRRRTNDRKWYAIRKARNAEKRDASGDHAAELVKDLLDRL